MSKLKVSNVPPITLCEGFESRLIHGAQMTWSFVSSKAGYELPSHAHPHEQVTHVVKGEFELTLNGVKHELHAGDILVIPSNVTHSGKSITDCEIIDVFHPVREDYQQKQKM
jgi:quercetin dioxygenase-like cupin family protein